MMNAKDAHIGVLGPAFWCAAPIPIVAICLGLLVTPIRFYDAFLGALVPVAVYGFTGFFGAALSFLLGLLLFFQEWLSFLTFRGRLAIVLLLAVCSCAGAIGLGLKWMQANYVLGPQF
jgi:hypothetical protein